MLLGYVLGTAAVEHVKLIRRRRVVGQRVERARVEGTTARAPVLALRVVRSAPSSSDRGQSPSPWRPAGRWTASPRLHAHLVPTEWAAWQILWRQLRGQRETASVELSRA